MSTELVQDGQVVSMQYSLTVDGKVLDASAEGEPLQFIQGEGMIIPGLEDALYGMAIGERKQVLVAPQDGYGEFDPDAFVDVPRNQFPAQIPLEPGVELEVRNAEGEPMAARIDKVEAASVRLDFNHPLAGKELHFDITIVSMRDATPEEMDHGHVHDDDDGHH